MKGSTNLTPKDSSFDFIDLFAGIGGNRMAFERVGGRCVYTSEWDAKAVQTYCENFGQLHDIHGDITEIDMSGIPAYDVLLGGFPCQPFSLAGVSKKNSLGRAHGFDDPTQGTLFFDVKNIIKETEPQAFMLENVKNLLSHDKKRTFQVIQKTLEVELGYKLFWKVLDAAPFVPQHRERVILVGFRNWEVGFSWDDLWYPETRPVMKSILHRTDGTEPRMRHDEGKYFDHERQAVLDKYTLTPNLWRYLQDYAARHRAAGNGFGYGKVTAQDVARTLSARYYKDGSEILVDQGENRPRRLTPRECARLMGLPDSFKIPVSDSQAYKQFGNSVAMPLIAEVARIMTPHLTPRTGAAPNETKKAFHRALGDE